MIFRLLAFTLHATLGLLVVVVLATLAGCGGDTAQVDFSRH